MGGTIKGDKSDTVTAAKINMIKEALTSVTDVSHWLTNKVIKPPITIGIIAATKVIVSRYETFPIILMVTRDTQFGIHKGLEFLPDIVFGQVLIGGGRIRTRDEK